MMSPIQHEIDDNGIEHTMLFGADIRLLGAIGAVIGALLLYAGPIIAGTIYLQNMFNAIETQSREQSQQRKVVNETSFSVLRQEVDRIKGIQDQVVAGQTAPQQLMRSAIDRLATDLIEQTKSIRTDMGRLQMDFTRFHSDIINLKTPLSTRVLFLEDRLKEYERTVFEIRRDLDRASRQK